MNPEVRDQQQERHRGADLQVEYSHVRGRVVAFERREGQAPELGEGFWLGREGYDDQNQ